MSSLLNHLPKRLTPLDCGGAPVTRESVEALIDTLLEIERLRLHIALARHHGPEWSPTTLPPRVQEALNDAYSLDAVMSQAGPQHASLYDQLLSQVWTLQAEAVGS